MQHTKTLTLKKPAKPEQKPRPEKSLVGKLVTLQTRSPSRIVGTVQSFDHGWVQIAGTEQRWQNDGSLSPVVTKGVFTLDRGVVTYIAEVANV